MYIFPGLGLGAVVSEARHVSDVMVLIASQTLADEVSEEMLQKGLIYPALTDIRKISKKIAVAVAKQAVKEGLSELDEDWESAVNEYVYEPEYAGLYNMTPSRTGGSF
jgi:malate dehydrogenase (oxaloacetate-decarboxylating)(NADP+)